MHAGFWASHHRRVLMIPSCASLITFMQKCRSSVRTCVSAAVLSKPWRVFDMKILVKIWPDDCTALGVCLSLQPMINPQLAVLQVLAVMVVIPVVQAGLWASLVFSIELAKYCPMLNKFLALFCRSFCWRVQVCCLFPVCELWLSCYIWRFKRFVCTFFIRQYLFI